MKAIEFPGFNYEIAKDQEEYNTLPVLIRQYLINGEPTSLYEHIMCFELSQEELEEINRTGKIWLDILKPLNTPFHPIGPTTMKLEGIDG